MVRSGTATAVDMQKAARGISTNRIVLFLWGLDVGNLVFGFVIPTFAVSRS